MELPLILLFLTNIKDIILTYLDLYLANETSDEYGPVDIFVPYNLRNNLICYLTLFSNSDIFMPIEAAIVQNTLYGKSDRVLEQTP